MHILKINLVNPYYSYASIGMDRIRSVVSTYECWLEVGRAIYACKCGDTDVDVNNYSNVVSERKL